MLDPIFRFLIDLAISATDGNGSRYFSFRLAISYCVISFTATTEFRFFTRIFGRRDRQPRAASAPSSIYKPRYVPRGFQRLDFNVANTRFPLRFGGARSKFTMDVDFEQSAFTTPVG